MTRTSRPPAPWSLGRLLGAIALGLLAVASSQALAADPIKIGLLLAKTGQIAPQTAANQGAAALSMDM